VSKRTKEKQLATENVHFLFAKSFAMINTIPCFDASVVCFFHQLLFQGFQFLLQGFQEARERSFGGSSS
jgi:hypothetical protein